MTTTPNSWWRDAPPPISERHQTHALLHQSQLTKPAGSLGHLELIPVQLAAIQHTEKPKADQVYISVFAGDHGIVAEGVSAFPQAVTVEMQRNFVRGGAAISVLSRHLNAKLEVINCGSHALPEQIPGVIHQPIANQTKNFLHDEAMTLTQWEKALQLGLAAIDRAKQQQTQLFIGGEMGIGNTTAATAILAGLTGLPITDVVGPGTGLDPSAVSLKAKVIQEALTRHQPHLQTPEAISRIVGGFEITALTGAYIRAAQEQIMAVVDGFICTAAAAIALAINPSIRPYLLFSHRSAEPGHSKVLATLEIDPVLDLNLRLGEGSGAAVLVPLIRLACSLHNEMATFAEAQVSGQLEN